MLPYVIELDGRFCGQLTIGNVSHGALRSAWIGYWCPVMSPVPVWPPARWRWVWITVSVRSACTGWRPRCGRRTPRAGGCWPAGFREEGLLRRYLHVDGAWRDHLLVALTAEEVEGSGRRGLVRRRLADWQ